MKGRMRKIFLSTLVMIISASCSNESVGKDKIEPNIDTILDRRHYPDELTSERQSSSTSVNFGEQIKEVAYPLSQYQDLNADEDFTFAIGVYIVQYADKLSAEQKINELSRMFFGENDYTQETDGFKKKDMANSLLLRINKEIARYKSEYDDGFHFKLPIIYKDSYSDQNRDKKIYISPDTFGLGQYNFENSSFPIEICGGAEDTPFIIPWENGKNLEYEKEGGAIEWATNFPKEAKQEIDNPNSYNGMYCELVVKDEALARRIEEAIVNDNLTAKGYVYYDVPIRPGNSYIYLQPILADITYYLKDTNELLVNKKLTW